MKNALIIMISIFLFSSSMFTLSGIKMQAVYKQEYKRAVDAGVDAAVKYATYIDNGSLDDLSSGFGSGESNKNNIPLDKNKSLEWFYRVFYRSLGIQDNEASQNMLKKYIPMKAFITFDNISIADNKDNWVLDKDFELFYNGKKYRFTLSDQIYDIGAGKWVTDEEIGLTRLKRQEMVSGFIQSEISEYLGNAENIESDVIYSFRLGLTESGESFKTVSGSNMIVVTEGSPFNSLNWFDSEKKSYAVSIGGSEITRE